MVFSPRLLLAIALPAVVLGQTQIELQQSKFMAPGTGAVTRSGASKLSDVISIRDFGAAGNGVTDDLPAINAAFAAVAGKGQAILFPAGTYMVSGTVVVPNKTVIEGVGRGDAGYVNTVIKALSTFQGSTVVQMGSASPSFGVRVENMTIDGSAVAGTCLANSYSEELSYGKDLLLTNCGAAPLVISTQGAQNSGPFENLEIYPGGGATVNTNSLCIQVTGVLSFRGIQGVTCNAGTAYASQPAVALAIDGDGYYSDIHIEQFATAIQIGSSANAADGMIVAHGQFGPSVTTGVAITAPSGINNQNVSIIGMSCVGCTSLLTDAELGTNITDNSVGWYFIGNGAGSGKPMMSGNNGVGSQVIGQFRALGNSTFGPSNPRTNATLSLYDATPTTGVTSMIEVGGAGQGSTNLFEWHNQYDSPVATMGPSGNLTAAGVFLSGGAVGIGGNGEALASTSTIWWANATDWWGTPDTGIARSAPGLLNVTNGTSGLGSMNVQTLQLSTTGTQPACAAGNRGTLWLVQGGTGTADHLQACAKTASGTYAWTQVF